MASASDASLLSMLATAAASRSGSDSDRRRRQQTGAGQAERGVLGGIADLEMDCRPVPAGRGLAVDEEELQLRRLHDVDAAAGGEVDVPDGHDRDVLVVHAVEPDPHVRDARVVPVHERPRHGKVLADRPIGEGDRLQDLLPADVPVHDDMLVLGRDVDLDDPQVGDLPFERGEEQMLPRMPLHQVVPSVPIDSAPDGVAYIQGVAGDQVQDAAASAHDLGHRLSPDGPGVADLAAAARVERRALQLDQVAVLRDDPALELGHVPVASENLLGHLIQAL